MRERTLAKSLTFLEATLIVGTFSSSIAAADSDRPFCTYLLWYSHMKLQPIYLSTLILDWLCIHSLWCTLCQSVLTYRLSKAPCLQSFPFQPIRCYCSCRSSAIGWSVANVVFIHFNLMTDGQMDRWTDGRTADTLTSELLMPPSAGNNQGGKKL